MFASVKEQSNQIIKIARIILIAQISSLYVKKSDRSENSLCAVYYTCTLRDAQISFQRLFLPQIVHNPWF